MSTNKKSPIQSFRQVLYRHALPGALIAVACLIPVQARQAGKFALAGCMKNPAPYVAVAGVLFVFMIVWVKLKGTALMGQQWGWFFYLLFVSTTEEWIFRVSVPAVLQTVFQSRFSLIQIILMCNVAFGFMHFFTLRWSLMRCAFIFVLGVLLSMLTITGDLMILIGVHWLGTFLNTPRPPLGEGITAPSIGDDDAITDTTA